jgi:subtilisin family serine protease
MLLPAFASVLVWSMGPTVLAVDRSMLSVPKHVGGLALAQAAAGQSTVSVLLSTQPGQAQAVARMVEQMGGQVTTVLQSSDFLTARVPAQQLADLEKAKSVRALGINHPVHLDPLAMRPLAEKKPSVPSDADPALSLKITRNEVRAPELMRETGNDGTGAVIAVVDTGVDPGHPDLAKTTGGDTKIIDWQDFTGEGDTDTKTTSTQMIPGIRSVSGVYHTGIFKESQIPKGEMESDINRNGKSDDQFPVLVTDARQKGVYDTVYVDTNLNGDFTDEKPLHVYNESFDIGLFGSAEVKDGHQQGVNFVITRIDAGGTGINLGYDGGEHGTHVSGIAAGNGAFTGIAPGAKIMAIKVLTSGGSGEWDGIIKGMQYAADHGANVINMSLGGNDPSNDGNDPQSLFVNELSEKTGVVFSIAAGNAGPGLNTVGLPGVAGAAITSGAYISRNTWKADYGLDVPQDGMWYFSSNGPRADGGLKPNVIAPGTANSSIPLWAGKYAVFQGTSMATPQTTGATALLVGAAKQYGLSVKAWQLTQALEAGARRLDGYGWYEQGHGLIQADAAWDNLLTIAQESNPNLVSFGRAKAGTSATGLYAREFAIAPGAAKWTLGNREYWRSKLDLTYLPGNGLTISGPAQANLSPLQRKEIPLQYQYDNTPGVYDALIQARIPGQTSYATEYLSTVVVPYEFNPAKGNAISGITGTLGPARYARYFVRVPAGTAELALNLTVPNQQGRVRLVAYQPDGSAYGTGTPYAGAPKGPDKQTLTIASPTAGVWEIDAYASHGSMNFGIAENKYSIDMAARGVYASPDQIGLSPFWGMGQSAKIHFSNYYGDIRATVAGVGFASPKASKMDVKHGDANAQFFDVADGTALIRATVSQVTDPNADLDIGLFYSDPQAGWMPVGQVSSHWQDRQAQVLNPVAGKYAIQVTGKNVPQGQTSFQFGLTQVQGGKDIAAKGGPLTQAFGSQWDAMVTFKTPASPGAYVGAVTVQDEAGKVLTVIPVDVK